MASRKTTDDFATHSTLIVSVFSVHSNTNSIPSLVANPGGSWTLSHRRISGYYELQLRVRIDSLLFRYKFDSTVYITRIKSELHDNLGNLITRLHDIADKQSAKGGNFLFHFAVLHRIMEEDPPLSCLFRTQNRTDFLIKSNGVSSECWSGIF